MRNYRVIEDWRATYEDPIVLMEGEELWLTGKTDDWDGHIWVWAKNRAGKEGWIPDQLVRKVGDKAYANTAFSALELTCHRGEMLEGFDKVNGWIMCTAAGGLKGWVPARNLQET